MYRDMLVSRGSVKGRGDVDHCEPSRDFVRVERRDDSIRVLVGDVTWDGPAHPSVDWTVWRELAVQASDQDVRKCVEELLASPAHFLQCEECGERNPLGWMHDECICQSCAERNHGVVY